MKILAAFVSGLIFSLGLTLGGMTIPSNIIGFLDLTGTWKPSLMFVMIGAILIYSVSFRWIIKRPRPVLDSQFHVPSPGAVTPRLIGGALLFGMGWGLAGFCPGPALTALGAGSAEALTFVLFMLAGMWVFQLTSAAIPSNSERVSADKDN
jgi:hypothetical protein